MDDLIATLSGTMHVSQESYDLESFKASLARTLVIPASPSDGSSRTRTPSLSFSLDGLSPSSKPLPSPAATAQYASYAGFPFTSPSQDVTPPVYNPYPSFDHSDDDLKAAFAGDAFASCHHQKSHGDQWGLFRASTEQQQQATNAFAFVQQQQQHGAFQQQAPQYAYEYHDDEMMMDEDMADDMLACEDEHASGGEESEGDSPGGFFSRTY